MRLALSVAVLTASLLGLSGCGGGDVIAEPINSPPHVELDGDLFVQGIKSRGNIPISFTVFDNESDHVQVAIQWRTAGGEFPLARNLAGQEVDLATLNGPALQDLLENPAREQDRLDAQIAHEHPLAYAGRLGTLAHGHASNEVRLPEVASTHSNILAEGIVGRSLEILRPSTPEIIPIAAKQPSGVFITEAGRSALVLYESGGGWEINEVDLVDGSVLGSVASGPGLPWSMSAGPLGRTLFVGTDTEVFRVERFTGVVSTPLPHGFMFGPRALAALGSDVVLATGDDELRRLDLGANAANPSEVLLSGLSEPWGIVRDPLRSSGIYLAERSYDDGVSSESGRVVSVDLNRLVINELAAEVRTEDLSEWGTIPFPAPTSLALERGGSALLANTLTTSGLMLRRLALRSPFNLSGPEGDHADPFIEFVGPLSSLSYAGPLAAGPDRLRVVTVLPRIGGTHQYSLSVSGGVAQQRSILAYDQATQLATLDGPLDPASATGDGTQWRIRARLEASGSPAGKRFTFVWDSSELPDPSEVEIRAVAAQADPGTTGSTSVARPYRDDFDSTETLPTGESPQFVAAADLDGDGDMDLVSANTVGNDLTLFFQTSPETFDQTVETLDLGPGAEPHSVAAADLDGDGDMDLVSTDMQGNSLRLFFQTSPGTFDGDAAITLELGWPAGPRSVAAADLDGDGDMDLVSTNFGAHELSLFFQTSPGNFDEEVEILETGGNPFFVTPVDLDGDQDMDLVSVNNHDLTLFYQTSPGSFTAAEVSPTPGNNPRSIAAADLDGDGDMDIVSANAGDDNLTLHWQASPGNLNTEALTMDSANPSSVAAADLDGDGDMDMVVASRASDELSLYFQTSPGNFSEEASTLALPELAVDAESVAAADLDCDGDMDLVAASYNRPALALFVQTSPGTFGEAIEIPASLHGAQRVEVADLDGDGDLDIVASNLLGKNLTLCFQTDPGIFDQEIVTLDIGEMVHFVTPVDLDADGDIDLVASAGDSVVDHHLTMFFQTSPGNFDSSGYQALHGDSWPASLAAADLDGDGDLDLTVGRVSGGVSLLFQTSPGAFTLEPSPLYVPDFVRTVAAADIDGDGDMDILAGGADRLNLFLQTSPGIFTPHAKALTVDEGYQGSVAIADLDGDGDMDLILANGNDHRIWLFFNGR